MLLRPDRLAFLALALGAAGCSPPPLPSTGEPKAVAPVAASPAVSKSDPARSPKVVTPTSRRFLDGLTLEVIAGRRRVEILRQAPEFAGVMLSDADAAAWGKWVSGVEAAQTKAEKDLAAEVRKVATLTPSEWEQELFLRNPDAAEVARVQYPANALRNAADKATGTYSFADVVRMPPGLVREESLKRQFEGIHTAVNGEVKGNDSYERARLRTVKGPDSGE